MSTIARAIKEITLAPGARVFIAPRKTPDVVTIEGSVYSGARSFRGEKCMVPAFAAELLDAGTKQRSKEVLRGTLSDKGATLSFYTCGSRLGFSASCLPEDLPLLVSLLVECLSESVFPAKEVENTRQRLLGLLTEERNETRPQAAGALLRAVYEPSHPNYFPDTNGRIESTKGVTRTDLVSFSKTLGIGGLVISVVGDITVESATLALRPLTKLPKGTEALPPIEENKKKVKAGELLTHIKDKANIDTYFGGAIPLSFNHPLYVPFTFLCDMLGSRGFSGHLMQTIRERDGLTYGIYAMPAGFDDGATGMFRIWATFSPATFKKAVAGTRNEMELFFSKGLNKSKIAERAERLVGTYLLGLSTTSGLASMLHTIGKQGKPLTYLDEYPEILKNMTIKDLKEAANLIPHEALVLSAAGSFDK